MNSKEHTTPDTKPIAFCIGGPRGPRIIPLTPAEAFSMGINMVIASLRAKDPRALRSYEAMSEEILRVGRDQEGPGMTHSHGRVDMATMTRAVEAYKAAPKLPLPPGLFI